MSCHAGPDIVENGLVFCYDMNNTKKSWRGKPATNLITNPTKEVIATASEFAIFEDISPIFDANGPGYYSISADIKSAIPGDITVYTASGAVEYNIGYYTAACETYYKRFYFNNINVTQTDPNTTYSNLSFYGGYGSGRKPSITNVQIEKNSFCTPFVAGTRSNTQAILDLTNKSIITANNVTYNSDNTFKFNSSGQRLDTNITTFGNNATWEAWFNGTSNVSTYNMFMGRYLPYFGFYGANRLFFSNTISGSQRTIETATNLTTNTWYHAVFTTSYDNTNTTMKIYTNGVETASGTWSGSQGGDGGNYFSVGDGYNANWYRFDGQVPMVKIYNRTLSAAEIAQNFNATRRIYGI